MGKSKKHGVEVPAPASVVAGEEKKKGKRGFEEAVEVKSLKKQKVAGNPVKEKQQSAEKRTIEVKEDKVLVGKEKHRAVEKRMTEVKQDKVSKLPSSMKGLQDSKAPIERAHAKHRSKGALDKPKTKEVKISAKSAAKLSAKVENQDVSTSEDSSEDGSGKNLKLKKQKVEVVKASLKPSPKKVESSDEEDSDEEESSDEPSKPKLKSKLQIKDVKKPTPKPSGKKMESIEESSSSDESSEDDQPKVEKQKPKSKELKKPGLPPTKKMESSSERSSEDSSEDESDEETKAVKPVTSSSEESSEDESDFDTIVVKLDGSGSEEEKTVVVKRKVDAVKSILQKPETKVSDVKAFVKKDDSSDESDESDSEEEPLPKNKQFKSSLQRAQTQVAKMPAKEESSDETDESDSEEEPNQNTKQVHLKPSLQKPKASVGKTPAKDEESSDDSDESSESDSDKDRMQMTKNVKQSFQKVQPPVGKLLAKEEESSDESDESDTSGSEEEPVTQNTKLKPSLQKAKTPAVKAAAKEEKSSDESDESDESDSEEEAVQKTKQSMPAKATSKGAANGNIGSAADDDGDDKEEDDEDEEEPQPQKTKEKENGKVKKGNQVITPGRGPTPGGGSKTVFVKNLAWSADEDSVQEFFSDAGEIHEVRLATGSDGRFRGFGHVEFVSEEGARKACEKSGHTFAGREIFVDMAQERIFSPSSGGQKDWKSPQSGGFSGSGNQRFSSDSTAFVKGFDKFQDEDTIRSSLMEFFNECGVQNMRIPTDRETGNIKGFAYIDFKDKEALYKAVEYNGSDLNGHYLVIEEAGGGGGGGGGGGRGGRGGRDFGGRGGRGGRGRGDFGDRGRGGRGGGRGGRGFGAPKQKINLSGTGKKTTFGED